MSFTLLDTHCHVDAYSEPTAVLDQAAATGVQIVAVTEDPGAYRRLRTRLGRREGVHIALGFHPLRAGSFTQHDLARFFRLLPQATWIGEIGLDFSRAGLSTKKQQLHVFDAILADPQVRARPLTVHSRGAERETVAKLAQAKANAVLHWYTGPLSVVDDALAAGLWFSVNPAMIRSAKAAAVLQRIPAERVLLETDGPYARHNNRSAVPADITATVQHLAQLWNTSTNEAQAAIVKNQHNLLGR